ncbi:zinc finger protein 518A [Mastacembelus armatus]|uniref:Zinc finger protein 518A n=1 Tax=Mastacembelus armatus TaxID=205130 RepID=A0A3Q3NFI5_9TELE|nr:zinc finger protein 518A [Mastacembelus armatus]XP_033181633.1 zinc finger protein 518A [Mastacembelus armatus]
MEEDLIIPLDSVKNSSISVIDDEKEKVKDFVYKHFREVTDVSLFNNSEDSSIKEQGSTNKKEKHILNKAHCKIQQGAVFSGKILSFGCSVCKDESTYSPNDLLKHFRAAHKGTLPTYPCDLCSFVTNEFPALQRHRIEHRNTLVTCELCNDDVQYSLLLLTRHYIMCHSVNGQFNCDWCEFTTIDAGTFVQHIHHHNESPWKCSKCRHISLNEEDHQKHVKGHSGTFPFTCQICGYGAARSEYLKKHTAAVHKEEAERINSLKGIEDNATPANSSANLKLLFKKNGESQEAQRASKLNYLSGILPNQNGRQIKPELSLEESHQLMDGNVGSKDNTKPSKGPHKTEQSTPVMLQENDTSESSDATSNTNPNGLTVLMVKNKISLPPNCTTKVMGFKMVDGKKHLVLKVIPTVRQDSSTQNHSSVDDLGCSAVNPVLESSKVSIENGECSKSVTSNCFAVSPRGESCIQVDQDEIMAVKVKFEEEETSICNIDSPLHRDAKREQSDPLLNRSSASPEMLLPMTNEFDHVDDRSYSHQTSCSEKCSFDNNLVSVTFNYDETNHSGCEISNTSIVYASKVSGLSKTSNVQETLFSKPVSKKTTENSGATVKLSLTDVVADKLTGKHIGIYSFKPLENDYRPFSCTPEKTDSIITAVQHKNGNQNLKNVLTNPVLPSESSTPTSDCQRQSAMGTEKFTHNSSNQEVFSFHNYSKEIFNASESTTKNFDSISKHSSENICKSSQFNLTLAESPESFTESGRSEYLTQEKDCKHMKKVFDHDSEVDKCITNVDYPSTEDENTESMFQDFNIIKIEEESIPISKNLSEIKCSSTSLGSFVEEHSDEIITQQLKRERAGSTSVSSSASASTDSLKQTKTTLRILQLPEGKQPLFLRTTENRFSMPVQVQATPGFKLIANSANPQINVSYMKPGIERSSNPTGVTLTPDDRRLGVSAPTVGIAEKGTAFLSAVQPGVSTTTNHYLINSQGFKGPVLLSSTPHNTPADKIAKTQPTCYLVQRSVPFTPSTSGLRLASTQLQLNSQPVLAVPMSSTDKPRTLQHGRQAFLLRYISPPKSGLLLNNHAKTGIQPNHHNLFGENTGNKVVFKIVTPSGSLLTSGTPTSSSQPLFFATRPQTQCFLVSSHKTNANASNAVQKIITIQNAAQKHLTESYISPSQMNIVQPGEAEKPVLAPRPIRPPSQRKRRRKPLFDELPPTVHKSRRLTNKVPTDKDTNVLWKPVAKEVERTLRLSPFSCVQQIRCPHRYQPVVVLNHPDADVPEVANIMKVVNRYKGAVTKVSLSQKTIQALSELGALAKNSSTKGVSSHRSDLRPRPVQSSVRERFLLRLKLRKKSKKKYEVVETLSGCNQGSVVFDCWFCGRLFKSQEDWIGHGQRHLMEATRDWNKLF